MIGFLHGQPRLLSSDQLLMIVQGVGYEVLVTTQTAQDLASQTSAELWIYTHVREDALQLFGFNSLNERMLFTSLLKVNGIGPKSAMNILGAAPFSNIQSWIELGDTKALSHLPKVGKKTAEQVVLTLQGKLVRVDESSPMKSSHRQEIVSALVHLGFRLIDVEKVVEQMPPDVDFQGGVRQGLSALTT